MVTDSNVIRQNHDELRRMDAGFLFFRWHQIILRNVLFFLLVSDCSGGSGRLGVVLNDYGWWFWPTTLFCFDHILKLF